ncbi:hypothetical protein [Roseisalinus antarcticus]|uniref:Uncharacterized protein n=1 Tax=Roseisalinus antarcticus TaxID=254357 RepID=A0A1Y5REN2_9RHOB|nr:hypothetical protein [Roseisalinus antarcticus]SLN15681.1 hypothetical protein ROA7023_00215 [Roseisalinus antarcticus]
MLWRLIKFLFVILILGGIALVGYAYVGPVFFPDDFDPQQSEIVLPVTLEPQP